MQTAPQHRPVLLLAIATVFAAGMFCFVARIWAAPPATHFSDLYSSWNATRELLLHGRDPYSPAVTREVQIWRYGHVLEGDLHSQQDTDRFVYPVYLTLILAPIARLPFATATAIFSVLLPALVAVSLTLWLSALRWRCAPSVALALMLLTLGSFPVLESLYLQQLALLAAAFLAGACAALSSGRLTLAGTLFALSTIKPQLSALLVLAVLTWALWNWRARKNLTIGFGVSLAALAGVSEMLSPGWIREFLAGLQAYQRYTGTSSILTLWFGKSGAAIGVVLLLWAAYLLWRVRWEEAGSERFNFALCAILTATLVVIPTFYPTGQIVLLPGLLWLLKNYDRVWDSGHAVRLTFVAVFALLGWQWVAAAAVGLASFLVGADRMRAYWLLPVGPLLLIPPLLLALFLIQAPAVLRVE